MNIKSFSKDTVSDIKKVNKYLSENHGLTVKAFSSLDTLQKLSENAQQNLVSIRANNKNFQLDTEYAKFLGIREVAENMIKEGLYAKGKKYNEMMEMITGTVRNLMDSGYTQEEACSECMNRVRMMPNAYDDEFVLPLVLKAAKDYVHETVFAEEESVQKPARTFYDIMGDNMVLPESGDPVQAVDDYIFNIAEKLNKNSQAVKSFFAGLNEQDIASAMEMFERKIIAQEQFTAAIAHAAKNHYDKHGALPKTVSVQGKDVPMNLSKDDIEKITGEQFESYFDMDDLLQEVDPEEEHEVTEETGTSLEEIGKKLAAAIQAEDNAAIDRYRKEYEDAYLSLQQESVQMRLQDIIKEDVDVEEAEVILAARNISNEIQDQIEKLGRLMNEDLIAITDQMRSELGQEVANQFQTAVSEQLQSQLDAAKETKDKIDQLVTGIAAGDTMAGDMSMGGEFDMDSEPEFQDTVEPAASGDDEPLGRAEVD